MGHVHDCVRPDSHVFLRLTNDTIRLIKIKPNTIIDTSKFGSFPANLILGRPYYVTYELLEPRPNESFARLRAIPASELNADVLAEEAGSQDVVPEEPTSSANGTRSTFDSSAYDTTTQQKNNRLTIDDTSRQTLTHDEIEQLKKSAGGKEIIERILASHTGLDEKTAFSKAKYLVRKRNKYIKRFTVLPMDLSMLLQYYSEKEAQRVLELRDESLGLITAWSNAHFTDDRSSDDEQLYSKGRWLVVEETGGLVVAALAERMNLLHATSERQEQSKEGSIPQQADTTTVEGGDGEDLDDNTASTFSSTVVHQDFPLPATDNTITLIHSAAQPNVSLLKYFDFDVHIPDPCHPLAKHLKTLSWLQLLHPDQDSTYREPQETTESEMQEWKSGKRGTYWRKRRRWQRCAAIVDETRAGEFDGLVVVSLMDPVTVLQPLVPLLRGGATVVVYSPAIEPLVRLYDLYSKERRAAYMQHILKGDVPDEKDFPLDPRQLLGGVLQTSRVRPYQVLPGRTHPLMTSKGGPEGFVFTARKAIPVDGSIEARGNHAWKRRKTNATVATPMDVDGKDDGNPDGQIV